MGDEGNVAALIGSPALSQLVEKVTIFLIFIKFNSHHNMQFAAGKSASEKKEMVKKIETQLVSFNGKEKLTVDEYYSVLKVQVRFISYI